MKYQLILADPPWAFRTFTSDGRTPTAKKFAGNDDHYPTMSRKALAALPVAEWAAKDALLAMWVVGAHCDEALALGKAWGFTFKTDLFYWLKQKLYGADQIDLFTGDIAAPIKGMGYHTRKQIEPCWLFSRGKGLKTLDHGVPQAIITPRREHSRKPDEQYSRLERLYGDVTRLEMFARQPRKGWDSWGNETTKFGEAA